MTSPSSIAEHETDSLASWAAQHPSLAERQTRLLSLIQSGQLDDEEALAAEYAWRTFWARPEQVAPPGKWRRWLCLAGRGWGKTRVLSEWAREQNENEDGLGQYGPGHIVARTEEDVRKVLIEGPAGILAMSPPWFRPVYEPSKKRITWPNGRYALTFSAEEPDQLRGPQCAWAIADELASWSYLADAWGNLTFGMRLGPSPRVAIATTPRPIPMLRQLLQDQASGDTRVSRGGTRQNIANLSPDAVADMEKRYAGTRLGRQELDGEILDDVAGALWTRAMLDAAVERGKPYAFVYGRDEARAHDIFERVVVSVDPSGSDGSERGDFIGIVTAGKLRGLNEAVVLRDRTCQARPEEWAAIVAAEFDHWNADTVVAERNFGGDMVRAILQRDRNLPVRLVTATRGKHVRAEPVSALYEQERIHHAKGFPGLDDELCFFTPNGYQDTTSPNRADAMVWAITDLMLETSAGPRIRRV